MGTYADPRVSQRAVGRYAQPHSPPPKVKQRDPIGAKVCLIAGALVMLGSGVLVVVPRLLAKAATNGITQNLGIPDELRAPTSTGPSTYCRSIWTNGPATPQCRSTRIR
jgi:hypothetical protein